MENHRSRVRACQPRFCAPLALCVGLFGCLANAVAAPPAMTCGSVVTRDVTLDRDIGPCPGDGLIAVASGITIDLAGHTIFAAQRAHVGVRLDHVSHVTVKGGVVEGFGDGLLLVGGNANRVTGMTVRNNRFGIRLEEAPFSGHVVERSEATHNRLAGIALGEGVSGATVAKSRASANAGYGIVGGSGSASNVIVGNVANGNGDADIALLKESVSYERVNLVAPVLDVEAPERAPYVDGIDYHVMAGPQFDVGSWARRLVPIGIALGEGATALVNPNPVDTSTSGCALEDYAAAGFQAGDVALVQRGTCTLDVKLVQAVRAGASGIVLFNEGQPGRTSHAYGAVGEPIGGVLISIPVMAASYATGFELFALTRSQPVTIRLVAVTWSAASTSTPASQSNLVTKSEARSALDESPCGSNRWVKNDFELDRTVCVDGLPGGIGATSHNY